jgi:dTDP-glucose 4,6-dehydratase
MKAMVTGGAGFIGSHLVKELVKHGSVLNYDKLTYAGRLENLKEVENNINYKFVRGDILDASLLSEVVNTFNPDVIFHLAAESHVDRSIESSDFFIKTNIEGTQTLLKESLKYFKTLNPSKQENFRFIHVSTDEVFGALGPVGEFSEESPYKPNSPYSASKASSDFLARAFYKTYGLPAIITNCSNNFGSHQYPEKLIPLMINNALKGKFLPVYGKGEQVRDWLYVKDHVDALIKVYEKGSIGQQYCIGGGRELKNIEIVTLICKILDDKFPASKPHNLLIKFVQDRPGHDFRYAIDSSKAKRDLNWVPKTHFDNALEETIKWYIDNQWWTKSIEEENCENKVKYGF